MKNFLHMMHTIANFGRSRPSRQGDNVKGQFGGELTYDLQQGFPLPSTKRVPFNSVLGELVGFIRGYTSAADFRELGCKVWDDNANKPVSDDGVPNEWFSSPHRKGTDDVGLVYGAQWRRWESIKMVDLRDNHSEQDAREYRAFIADGYEDVGMASIEGGNRFFLRKEIDQLQNLIDGICNDPYGRRHIVTAWNPGVLKEIALPACHTFFQCYVRGGEFIDLKMYQRSADMFLGVPYNIASYAALTHVIAYLTGYKPGQLTITFGDAHVYDKHEAQVAEQTSREVDPELPTLSLLDFETLDELTPGHFRLTGYNPQPTIKAPMSL